jgi:hypothetical protein
MHIETKERERAVVTSLLLLLGVLWLGFVVHRSPRFPGSLYGGLLAISGALLMLGSLGYAAVKRIPAVKAAVTRHVPMHTVLSWHVYAGLLGATLALLHTSHKFTNALGISLTASMFAVVLSGYLGRYFMGMVAHELHEKEATLARLEAAYRNAATDLAQHPEPAPAAVSRGGFGRFSARLRSRGQPAERQERSGARDAVRLAESIADLEYAVRTHEMLKRSAARWLWVHITASGIFCVLLALHIWAAIYFGLRWFQ